jgi:hypothetical protein
VYGLRKGKLVADDPFKISKLWVTCRGKFRSLYSEIHSLNAKTAY